jgi:hypothetical protein
VFDPRTCDVLGVLDRLIGTSTPCGTFTRTDALVVQEIWQGPRYSGSQHNLLTGFPVWFGMEPGANLAGAYLPVLGPGGGLGLATTYQLPSGQWSGAPFIPSADWFQNWIKMDPNWVYTDAERPARRIAPLVRSVARSPERATAKAVRGAAAETFGSSRGPHDGRSPCGDRPFDARIC